MLRIAFFATLIALPIANPSAAQDYRIAINDLLQLRVLDWDAVAGEVRIWPEMSGEYRVGPDGFVVVPFAGRVVGAGRTPDEIEADITAGLRERLALSAPPDVTVELAAWRPVIVTGHVRTPGQYDYSPGMVAMQAVGLAGGTGSILEKDASLRREVASQQTTLMVLRGEERRLTARQARLQAELEDRSTIEIGQSLEQNADWTAILATEEQLMRIRRDRLGREISAIDSQVELFTAEIDALEQKTAALNRQRDLANEQASDAGDLAQRGLVGNQRVFDTARTLADIESQLLDVSTAILRARQNLATAERERISLQDSRTAEIVETLQEVDAQLTDTRQRIAGQLAILQALEAGELTDVAADPEIVIHRPENGEMRRIEEAGMVTLLPGDMVEVIQPLDLNMVAAAISPRAPAGNMDAEQDLGEAATPAAPAPEPIAVPISGPQEPEIRLELPAQESALPPAGPRPAAESSSSLIPSDVEPLFAPLSPPVRPW